MDELLKQLDAARSHLGNLQYSRNSAHKPDTMLTVEQLDMEIADQETAIQNIITQLEALPRA